MHVSRMKGQMDMGADDVPSQYLHAGSLLLTWFNFNPIMDK